MRRAAWAPAFALAALWLGGMVVYLGMQATPVGGLRGGVLAEETGGPLPGARVQLVSAAAAAATGPYQLHGFPIPRFTGMKSLPPTQAFTFRSGRDGRFVAYVRR